MTGPTLISARRRGLQILQLTAHIRLAVVASALLSCCPTLSYSQPATNPPSAAEATSQPQESLPLTFRRVFVPADNVQAWPRGSEKYLPIEPQEFNSWISAANRTGSTQETVFISDAEYLGRFENDRTLGGSGRWKIELKGEGPEILSLPESSIVIQNARWEDDAQRPVRLGAWGEDAEEAQGMGLEVSQSGTLAFDWTSPVLPGHHRLEVPWRLPSATICRLRLDLSEDRTLQVEGPLVVKSVHDVHAYGEEGLRQWEIVGDGTRDSRLQITDRSSSIDPSPKWTLHEQLHFAVTQKGLDIKATWKLSHIGGELPRELVMKLPTDVRIVSVMAGGKELSWQFADGAPNSERQLRIQLPELSPNGIPEVTVHASHPLMPDAPWVLPRLRPEAVMWISGGIKIDVSESLELRQLDPTGCIQTDVRNLTGEEDGPQTWQLAAFSPEAKVAVIIGQPRPKSALRIATKLQVLDPDIAAELKVEGSVTHGKVYQLSGKLARGWIVENVETVPAEALGEWFVSRNNGDRRLDIQLAEAARPRRDVSVVIRARLPKAEFSDSLPMETLRIVQWDGPRIDEHVLGVVTTEPLLAEAFGGLKTLERESIVADATSSLTNDPAPSALFELSTAPPDAGVSLVMQPGQYSATIEQNANLSATQLEHVHHITVTPISNRIDRVLVSATRPLQNVRWIDASSGSPLNARKLSPEPAAGQPRNHGGESWVIQLLGPTSAPIKIIASSTASWPSREDVPLLFLPEAMSQSGNVFVRANWDVSLGLEPARLTIIPLPNGDSLERLPVRTAYRYQPADCRDSSRTPRLVLEPQEASDVGRLVARRVQLETYLSAAGQAVHNITYSLTNPAGEPLDIRLPPQATLRSVSIDQNKVEPTPVGTSKNSPIRIPVPRGSSVVALNFDLPQAPLSIGGMVNPPRLDTKTPLLTGEWIIHLPDEFSIVTADRSTWRERIFGPLGRPVGARPFRPFQAGDWANVLNGIFSGPAAAEQELDAYAGWRTYSISFVGVGPSAVSISHRSKANAWAACVFLVSLAIGSIIRRHLVAMFVLFVLACAIALLLPAALMPLAAGALLGMLFSFLIPRKNPSPIELGGSTHWHRMSTVGVSILLALSVLTVTAFGQAGDQQEQPDDAVPTRIHQVLIPVDESGRETGGKYFVSEEFASELIQRAQQLNRGNQWLMANVSCTGELVEDESQGVAAGSFELKCDIEVLARDTTIVLPLRRDQASWSDTALLDGVPIPIEWRGDGQGCVLKISEPGRYALRLAFTPHTTTQDGRRTATISLPTVRPGVVRLVYPPKLVDLGVSGVSGRAPESMAGAASYELDGSGSLQLDWPTSDGTSDIRSGKASQMEWLRLDQDKLELVVKYRFEGADNDYAEIVHHPDWRISDDDAKRLDAQVTNTAGNQTLVHFKLPVNDTDTGDVIIRWRLSEGWHWGHLFLPPIEVVSHSVTQAWRAVSAPPDVECLSADEVTTAGTADEFLAAWGESERADAPPLILGNKESSGLWSLTVRPRQLEREFSETLHIAARTGELDVVYEAMIETGSAEHDQFRLIIPRHLTIKEVRVESDDQYLPHRWCKVDDDRINVFYMAPGTEACYLFVSGTLPVKDETGAPLPNIHAADDERVKSFHFYRQEDSTLEVQGLPETITANAAPLEAAPDGWNARRISGYRLDPSTAEKIQLVVSRNRLELTGDNVTALSRTTDGWRATYYGDVTASQGLLSMLQLKVPAAWTGVPTLESSVPASITVESQDTLGKTLLIRFSEALPTGTNVKLRVDAAASFASAAVSVPQVAMSPALDGASYIWVPTAMEGQSMVWDELGVRQSALPTQLQAPFVHATAGNSYEIVSQPFAVALQPSKDELNVTRVRLADTTVYADDRRAQLMTTRFVIESDQSECTLRLPANHELIAIHLAGRPALNTRLDARTFRVTLGPPELPSELEVVSRTSDVDTGGRLGEVRRPVILVGNEVANAEIGFWSFGSSSRISQPSIAGMSLATADEIAILRFNRLLSIAESASAAAAELPPDDAGNWCRPWAAELSGMRSQISSMITRSSGPQTSSQVIRPLHEQFAETSIQLDALLELWAEEFELDETVGESPGVVDQNWADFPIEEPTRWSYCITDGTLEYLTIDYATAGAGSQQSRLISLLALGSLAIGGLLILRRNGLREAFYHWPHAIGFLIGLAYWAWLQPSWLGLVIAALSVVFACRSSWPGRAIRLDASTVLRASRPK